MTSFTSKNIAHMKDGMALNAPGNEVVHLCANDVNDGCLATVEGTFGDRIALRRSWVPFLPGTLKIF